MDTARKCVQDRSDLLVEVISRFPGLLIRRGGAGFNIRQLEFVFFHVRQFLFLDTKALKTRMSRQALAQAE